MASPAQAAANLANSQHSTGPRTEAGKKTSSRNAMTHGLYSSMVVIKGESQDEFNEFREQVFIDLAPACVVEVSFVDDLASILWRLRRMQCLEAREYDADEPNLRLLNLYSLNSSRLRRDAACVLRCLSTTQKDRLKREQQQLPAAIAIRQADLAANRDTDLDQLGFDLSVDFVDQQIRQQAAVNQAARTPKPLDCRKAA